MEPIPQPLVALEQHVNPDLVVALNAISEHLANTGATYEGKIGVNVNPENRSTTISLPLETTLAQLFETFKKGEGTHDSSILLLDAARLLSCQEAVQQSPAARSFVEDLYRVGYLMEHGTNPPSTSPASQSDASPAPSSLFEIISREPLTHPEPDYQKELAFWMIGKGDSGTRGYWTLFERRSREKGGIADKSLISPNTDIFDTAQLRKQLPEVLRSTAKIQQDRISKLDARLLRRFQLMLHTFVHQLDATTKYHPVVTKFIDMFRKVAGKPQKPNHTQLGINRVATSTATRRITNIPYVNATTNIIDNLKVPPPDRLRYITSVFKSLFGDSPEYDQFKAIFTDSAKLFDAVDQLVKTEKWRSRESIEKVRDIWDIVQVYEHKETYSPKLAIEERAFECALKSYVSGLLIKQYIPEVKVAYWQNADHAKLMVQCNNTIYSYDANLGINRHTGVTDTSIKYGSGTELGLDPLSEAAGRRYFATGIPQYGVEPGAEGYYVISDFDTGACANIILCIDFLSIQKPLPGLVVRRNLLRRTIELSPNYPEAFYNLAIIAKDEEEQRRLYRKVIELNPNYSRAYVNLANIAKDEEEQRRLYRKAIELNPDIAEAYYNLAVISDLPEKITFFQLSLFLKPSLIRYVSDYAANIPDTDGDLKAALSKLLAESSQSKDGLEKASSA